MKRTDKGEPRPGEGIRNLHAWGRIAAARRALDQDPAARQRLADDPVAFLSEFNIDKQFLGVFLGQNVEVQPPPRAAAYNSEFEEDEAAEEAGGGGGCGTGGPKKSTPEATDPVVRTPTGRVGLRLV